MKKVAKVFAGIIAGIVLLIAITVAMLSFKPLIGIVERVNPVFMDKICMCLLYDGWDYYLEDWDYYNSQARYINRIHGDTADFSSAKNSKDEDYSTLFSLNFRLISQDMLTEKDVKILEKYDQNGSLRNLDENLKKVTTIILPKDITYIDRFVYKQFPNLEKFQIENGAKDSFVSEDGMCVYAKSDNFWYCITWQEDTNEKYTGLIAISPKAKEIFVPENVAFFYDWGKFSFNEELTFKVDEANQYFKSDETGKLLLSKNGENVKYCSYLNGTYKISEGVKTIDMYAFSQNAENVSLILPSSFEAIDGTNMEHIVGLYNENGEPYFKQDKDNVLLISPDGKTLVYCYQTKGTVTIPDGVVSVRKCAFCKAEDPYTSGNEGLTVIAPESLQTIEGNGNSNIKETVMYADGTKWKGDYK